MSKLEAIRNYISECEFLKDGAINVSYLDDELSYSIVPTPTTKIVKKFVDGSSIRDYNFTFMIKEQYTCCIEDSISSTQFFEDFQNWIEEMNIDKDLPALDKGETPMSLTVITDAYLWDLNSNYATYQIELKLRYLKEMI